MASSITLLNSFVHRYSYCKLISYCNRQRPPFHTLCRTFSQTLKHCIKHCGGKSQCTYNICVRSYATLKHSIISDLTQGIDTEALKEKCRRHLLMTGNEIRFDILIQEEMKARFKRAVDNFTEQEKRTLKIIQLEHSFLYSQGYAIPSPDEMTNEHWLQAMTIETMDERFHYYMAIEKLKDQQASSTNNEEIEVVTNERVYEDSNSIFYGTDNPDLEVRWGNHRLVSAMQFGIPLVIDMDFVDVNSAVELVPLTQQLWDMYCVNRAHPEPFHLIFTNCSELNPIYRHLLLNHMIKTSFILATFTEKSHTEMFHRQDMVYLSAQSHNVFSEFNRNRVYILGAYYDPLVRKKVSLARARQHKIKNLRFPISENVRWRHQASKDLDMNHALAVLLDVKSKIPWKQALISQVPMLINHVPR